MGLEPMTLRYWCNALSTELSRHMDRWSIVSSLLIPDDSEYIYEYEYMKIIYI